MKMEDDRDIKDDDNDLEATSGYASLMERKILSLLLLQLKMSKLKIWNRLALHMTEAKKRIWFEKGPFLPQALGKGYMK